MASATTTVPPELPAHSSDRLTAESCERMIAESVIGESAPVELADVSELGRIAVDEILPRSSGE